MVPEPSSGFTKRAPQRAVRAEVAGLRWLAAAQADGGTRVAQLLDAGDGWLRTARISPTRPTPEAAELLGRTLARTHAAGAAYLGCPPPGLEGDGAMGDTRLPMRSAAGGGWGEFYATERLLPYLPAAIENGSIDARGARVLEACARRLAGGELDAPQPRLVTGAARIHGDLWAGNVMYTDRSSGGGIEPVLIDPAAHGGHAESDLAQLAVFAAPLRERTVAAYDEVSPLAEGWRGRVGLHQLHILVVHAAIFGGGYGAQTVDVAARYA